MKAIRDTGNNLVAAVDKSDSVGVLDSYFPKADFFTEFERFDRHIEKLKRKGTQIDYVTVCSPNYLHDAHIRFGLRIGADIVCEKPVVLNPWNLDPLIEIANEKGRKANVILQLRLHPAIQALKKKVEAAFKGEKFKVALTYITPRGNWYHTSWKGDITKSGGIATNIGIHFFDLLLWIFGDVEESHIAEHSATKAKGSLVLQKATIDWFLSIDGNDLMQYATGATPASLRVLTVNDEQINLNEGFADLHTSSYQEIVNGNGFSISEVQKVTQLLHQIRNTVA